VSLGIGAFNGWLLVRTGLPSFLVTLATFLMLQGLNLGMTKIFTGNVSTNDISTMDGFDSAKAIFASDIPVFGVSVKVTVFWWLAFIALGTWVLLRTKVGNWIFAVGGKSPSARAVGVPIRASKTTQGIVYAGWNADWFKFFLGAMLLLATLVNAWVRIQANRR
jgi:simple sugar transport system permease protein